MISKQLVIKGRVQGVSYRAWFAELAKNLNLSGWVRNRLDGTVEALVHGTPADIEAIIRAAHSGPTLAKVEEIIESDAPSHQEAGFIIKPTA